MNEVQKKRVEIVKENIVNACRSEGITVEDLREGIIDIFGEDFPIRNIPETTPKSEVVIEKSIESTIMKLFIKLGIPSNIRGYEYLKEAILYVMENGQVFMTKELYPDVAKKLKTTSSKVERAIRYAIGMVFERGDPNTIRECFGFTINPEKNTLTNSEFIYTIVEHLKYA